MADSSYFRDRAGQALRIARDSTDPELIKSLEALAAQYSATANAIDAERPVKVLTIGETASR